MSFAQNFEAAQNDNNDYDSGPIPEGDYKMRLRSVETEEDFSGLQATTLEFEIIEGPHEKRRLWEKVVHKDGLEWKAQKFHKGLGLEGTPQDWSAWVAACREMTTTVCDVRVIHRTGSEGKVFTNIRTLKPGAPF